MLSDPVRSVSPARLFWLILTIAGAGLLLSFPIQKSRFFRRCCEQDWLHTDEAAFRIRNADCRIVIYGDSTTIVGLDSEAIEAATRLKTCNVAQTGGVPQALGLDPLDRFLANNPKPALLLLQFHPYHYRAPETWHDDYVVGFIAMVKFYPPQLVALAAARHPDSILGLMYNVFSRGTINGISRMRGSAAALRDRDAYLKFPMPPLRNCLPPTDRNTKVPDPAWLRLLRSRYTGRADHLLLNINPGGSACHPPEDQIRSAVAGLTDNRYEVLPTSFFRDEFDHPSSAGVEYLSRAAASQIVKTLDGTEGGHRAL